MSDKKRGPDAQDHVPASNSDTQGNSQAKQDAANYETTDQGQAIEVENLSSENDEGAN